MNFNLTKMAQITPLIKSIHPVLVNSRTGMYDYIYFANHVSTVNEHERYKDQDGCATFMIGFYTKNEDGSYSEIPTESPHPAKYKLSTFLSTFGVETISDFFNDRELRANLMIQEISANSEKYWDLTSDKLEMVTS